ncbi:MAG: hypothetical protein ABI831_09930 [Betaproteobacteria bacterium]
MIKNNVLVASLLLAAAATPAHAAVFSASGAAPANIQATVDSFRIALGTPNPNVAGSFPSGRREINWDGVPDASAAPNAMSGTFFNTTSPRGVVFSTAGSGFQVSASAASGTPLRFGNIDPSYTTQFQIFSAQRLFTAIGSNAVQVDFFVPGTNTPATVSGFGAVFTDAETAGATKFTVFLGNGANGGQFAVPVAVSGGLSFLGLTDPNRYSRVIIQFGNAAKGAGILDNPGGGVDLVAMDDFIYGEPQLIATLDVDQSITASKYDALTDGLLVLRYLFGLTGPSLTNGALGGTATRTDPAVIKTYLDAIRIPLDIDGNGTADALTDGLLVIRYLFGLRGSALIAGAFDPTGTRTTAAAIEAYIQSLMP